MGAALRLPVDYSLKDNYYLNSAAGGLVRKGPLLPGQENVSQAELEALELAQLAELWSGYGSLSETWFGACAKTQHRLAGIS